MTEGPAEPRAMSGRRALLIALPLGIAIALTLPTRGPSRGELAQALAQAGDEDIGASDLRDLDCRESTDGYACRWQQREAGEWTGRTGALRGGADGWRMIGTPKERATN